MNIGGIIFMTEKEYSKLSVSELKAAQAKLMSQREGINEELHTIYEIFDKPKREFKDLISYLSRAAFSLQDDFSSFEEIDKAVIQDDIEDIECTLDKIKLKYKEVEEVL